MPQYRDGGKLTPRVARLLARGRLLGATHKDCARLAGISETTYAQWRYLGERLARIGDESSKYARLWRLLEKAEAARPMRALAYLSEQAAGGSTRAALALLDREEDYRQEQQAPMSINVLVQQVASLSDDELRRLARGEPLGTPLLDSGDD